MSSLPNVTSQLPGSVNQPQADVGGQQNVGAAYDPSTHYLIEREKFANVGDPNNAIHDAKMFQDYKQNGMVDLGSYLDEQGYSPWEIKRILENQGAGDDNQPFVPPEQQPVAQPTDRPAGIDEGQVQRMIQQGIQMYASQQSTQQAFESENRFMASAVEGLGVKDELQGLLAKSQLEALCKRSREQSIHASNPNRHALINAAYTKSEIDAAVNELKPHLAAQARTSLEQQADNQAAQNLPRGSLDGGGTGGRSQVPTDQMSRDQKRELAEKRYEATHGVKPM